MNIDYRSLEKRYGTLLAAKINEEISRADQRRFSFYRIPEALKAIYADVNDDDDLPEKSNVA